MSGSPSPATVRLGDDSPFSVGVPAMACSTWSIRLWKSVPARLPGTPQSARKSREGMLCRRQAVHTPRQTRHALAIGAITFPIAFSLADARRRRGAATSPPTRFSPPDCRCDGPLVKAATCTRHRCGKYSALGVDDHLVANVHLRIALLVPREVELGRLGRAAIGVGPAADAQIAEERRSGSA